MYHIHELIKHSLFGLECLLRGHICNISKTSEIRNVRFLLRRKGTIQIGENSKICRGTKCVIDTGNLYVGHDTCLGENCTINCFEEVHIGDNVVTADGVNFITNTHNYKNINKPINEQGGEFRPIFIGDGSWIGINATILDGTTIGKNCVIGAHAVVKGHFPDYCVIAGVPGRIIKRYDANTKEWKKM